MGAFHAPCERRRLDRENAAVPFGFAEFVDERSARDGVWIRLGEFRVDRDRFRGGTCRGERSRAAPAVAEGVDVDDDLDQGRLAGEEPVVGRDASADRDHGAAAEDGVGARLAHAGAGHRVGAAEAEALLADHFAPPRGLAEVVGAGGKVEDDVDSARGGDGARGHGRPQVFADLDAEA